MSKDKHRLRRLREFGYGIIAGICSNWLVESILNITESIAGEIPLKIWLIQFFMALLVILWIMFRFYTD